MKKASILFFLMLFFAMGYEVASYQAEKHLKDIELPKCECVNLPPKELPNKTEVVEDLKELEVFINSY